MEKCKDFKSGLLFCIMSGIMFPAAIVLIVFATIYGSASDIIFLTIFSSSLFLLYLFSTLYYWIKNETANKVFLKFINILSYIFIASAYSTICLGPLIGPWGWSIFGVVLGLSLLGIIASSIWANIPNVILISSQTLIASLLFIAIKPLLLVLLNISYIGLLLFIFSYICYIFASIFKQVKKLNIVANIFLILGSICTYIFLFKYLLFI